MSEGGSLEHISNLLHNIKQPSDHQKIALPFKDGYEFVEVGHIIYCHAEGAYTKVFMDDKKCILVSKTLGDIGELLPPDLFQRIHHSSVVNLEFITHFVRSDGGYVKLKTGEKLAVSKSKKDELMERLGLK
jgi:two-component system LytT family response regulator